MAKLAKVTLRHRRKRGWIEKVNLTDYAMNIGAYARDWQVVATSRGDATDREVARSVEAAEIEMQRRTDPAEQRRRGDNARIHGARAITRNVVTEPPGEVGPPPAALDPDWRAMAWFRRRQHVGQVTGTVPTSARHAEQLVAALEP